MTTTKKNTTEERRKDRYTKARKKTEILLPTPAHCLLAVFKSHHKQRLSAVQRRPSPPMAALQSSEQWMTISLAKDWCVCQSIVPDWTVPPSHEQLSWPPFCGRAFHFSSSSSSLSLAFVSPGSSKIASCCCGCCRVSPSS